MITATPQLYYVYKHIRPDIGRIFYIGIGKEGTKRAWSTSGRNKHWKNIVAKNNKKFKYEFLHRDILENEAKQFEIDLICEYGRIIDGGCLVNVLSGGQLQDIGPNYKKVWSEEVKLKMSKGHLGNASNTGRIAITNGIRQTYILKDDVIFEGWWKGTIVRKKYNKELKPRITKGKPLLLSHKERLERRKRALGNQACLGKFWITTGFESKLINQKEIIPTGWRRGRHHVTNPTGTRIKKIINLI